MTRSILYFIACLTLAAGALLGAREFITLGMYYSAIIIFMGAGVMFCVVLAMYDHHRNNEITLKHHELMIFQDEKCAARPPGLHAQVLADRKSREGVSE